MVKNKGVSLKEDTTEGGFGWYCYDCENWLPAPDEEGYLYCHMCGGEARIDLEKRKVIEPKTIVFDLDGVLCEYVGWRGHSKFGKPIKEMIDLVKKLHAKGHILKLCTTRLNPFPFGKDKWDMEVRSGEAYKRVYGFLSDNDIEKCFTEISGYKPFADYYIDDRAIRYSIVKDKYGGQLGVELYQLLLSNGT